MAEILQHVRVYDFRLIIRVKSFSYALPVSHITSVIDRQTDRQTDDNHDNSSTVT